MVMLRRFEEHTKVGKPYVLAADHPAVVEGRSLFTKPAGNHSDRILVSGFNSKKIGKRVIKGRWAGMPIFTLTRIMSQLNFVHHLTFSDLFPPL